jgi:hypothetical protein
MGAPQAHGVRAERFAVCHNPEQAWRDQLVRDRLVAHLQGLIEGSDAWTQRKPYERAGSLRDKPGLRRFLRCTKTGLLPSSAKQAWTASGCCAPMTRRSPPMTWPVLAENVVLAGQAACWYSWMTPPARSRRRTRKASRSVISAGSGLSGAALDRAI